MKKYVGLFTKNVLECTVNKSQKVRNVFIHISGFYFKTN